MTVIVVILMTINASKVSLSDNSMAKNKYVQQNTQMAKPQVIESSVVMATVPSPTSTVSPKTVELGDSNDSPQGIRQYITEKFAGYASVALCIVDHEDGTYDPARVNVNDDPWGSWDVGIFQINLHWHPDVTYAEMTDWRANVDKAYELSNGGRNWNAWSTKYYCI